MQVAGTAIWALVDPMMTKLEMSRTVKFFIWSIGPFSGLIVQPIVGYYSDRCESRFGRRRPYIFVGGVGTFLGLTGLLILYLFSSKLSNILITFFLFVTIVFTYVSINAFQGPGRSIIADLLPESLLNKGFAMGAMYQGLGAVITNLIGGIGYFINSPKYQKSTFALTLSIVSFTVFVSLTITIIHSKETQYFDQNEKVNIFKKLWDSMVHMSKPMARASFSMTMSWVGITAFFVKLTTFFSVEVFTSDHDKGLCFGLFVTAVVNFISFIYGYVHDKVVDCFGMKPVYLVAHIIFTVCLVAVSFTKNHWLLLGIFMPLGFAITCMNSIPFAIVSADSSPADLGINLGVLNIFIVLGQQITNLCIIAIGAIYQKFSGLQKLVGENQLYISFGSVGALIAALSSFILIVPKKKEDGIHLANTN